MKDLNGCEWSPQLHLGEEAGATWERRNVARPWGERKSEKAECPEVQEGQGDSKKGDAGPACPRGHH